MSRIVPFVLLLCGISTVLSADHVGKLQVRDNVRYQSDGRTDHPVTILTDKVFLHKLSKGEFALNGEQEDSLFPGRTHARYQQIHNGFRVFGASVVVEREGSRILGITGQFYPIDSVDMIESISAQEAFSRVAEELNAPQAVFDPEKQKRVIFPRKDGRFRLCHHISVSMASSHQESALVDREHHTIYLWYSTLKFDTRIGIGVDYHGQNRKFPHSYENGVYYLWDDHAIRPVKLATYDMRTGGYVAQNSSEYWQGNGTNVSAHYNVGLVYDFLYLYLGRQGLNNNNIVMQVVTHRSEYRDNASWNGQSLNFYQTGNMQAQFAASLDVVAHECAHAVTQYSSNLVYSYEPGALNESFSDIIGSAAEIYWHPSGSGLFQADWYIGEDAFPNYNYGISKGYVRYLADPNRFSQFGDPNRPDPCHLSQFYALPFRTDRGGVHINMTIYSHAFYLLTAGGTNRVSHKSVSGIGLEKALKIFYRAWVYKLSENSQFIDAAQALLDSARDLYGQSSNEMQQTIRAMEAIGWTVN